MNAGTRRDDGASIQASMRDLTIVSVIRIATIDVESFLLEGLFRSDCYRRKAIFHYSQLHICRTCKVGNQVCESVGGVQELFAATIGQVSVARHL